MNTLKDEYFPTEAETAASSQAPRTTGTGTPGEGSPPQANVEGGGQIEGIAGLRLDPGAYTRVIFDLRLTHTAVRFWFALVSWSLTRGFCYYGVDTICRLLGFDEKTVPKARAILVDCGYLKIERMREEGRETKEPEALKKGGFIMYPLSGTDVVGFHHARSGFTVRRTPHGKNRMEHPARMFPHGKHRTESSVGETHHITSTEGNVPPIAPQGGHIEPAAPDGGGGGKAGRPGGIEATQRPSAHATPEALKTGMEGGRGSKRQAQRRLVELVEAMKQLRNHDGSYVRELKPHQRAVVVDLELRMKRHKEGSSKHQECKRLLAVIKRNPVNYDRGSVELPEAAQRMDALFAEAKELGAMLGIPVSKPAWRKRPPVAPSAPMTEDQLLESARFAVESGLKHRLNDEQKAALKRAGEWH